MRLHGFWISLGLIAALSAVSCRERPGRPIFFKGSSGDANSGDSDDADSTSSSGAKTTISAASQAGAVNKILADEAPECVGKEATPGRKSLRLLTRAEYYNTVKDILKVASDPTGSFPIESAVNGFPNNVEMNSVSSDHLSAYVDAAITIADNSKTQLATLVGCSESAGASCAQKVIDVLGPKLYRRPLTADEKAAAINVYNKGATVSAREGMTALISSLLVSPAFLYRSEIGNNSNSLDAYEIASALSYFFWGTSPDDALTADAASGKLTSPDEIVVQGTRLWKDPRSRYLTDQFAHGWLESQSILAASKDASLTSTFTADIQKAMLKEADDTFEYLMKQPAATFATVIASDFTIGDQTLANYYNGQATNDGTVSKIKFPNTTRRGLVSLGAVMAAKARPEETHPIKRGDFALEKMLCFVPPPTPKDLMVQIPAKDPTKTTRERFAAHSSSPACAGCHVKIDGIGFGLEDYDTLGRYRTMENNIPVDTSGTMVGVDGGDIKFSGGGDLASKLATSTQAKRCFSVQWYRYAHGRSLLMEDADVCSSRDLAVKFSKGDIALPDLLLKIISGPSFLKRGF